MTVTLYSWRRKDPRTGRWRALRWKMTEDDVRQWAAMEGAEIQKVSGTDETRADLRAVQGLYNVRE